MRHTMVTYTVKPFWWTEVHRYGLEVAERLEGIPLIRVRSKELLGAESARRSRGCSSSWGLTDARNGTRWA